MFKIQNLILLLLIVIGSDNSVIADNKINELKSNVIVGASQISDYENLIKNKRIGVIANHTSVIFKENDSFFKRTGQLSKRTRLAFEELSRKSMQKSISLLKSPNQVNISPLTFGWLPVVEVGSKIEANSMKNRFK